MTLLGVMLLSYFLQGVSSQKSVQGGTAHRTWGQQSAWATLGGSSMRWGRSPDWIISYDDATRTAVHTFDAAFARFGTTGTGPILAQPIISLDNTIYVRAGASLFAFEGSDGTCPTKGAPATGYVKKTMRRKWSILVDASYNASAPRPERVSTPALASDGTIILGSMDGHVYGVHPNGTLRWKLPLGGPIESSPAIGWNGLVAIGCNDMRICALSALPSVVASSPPHTLLHTPLTRFCTDFIKPATEVLPASIASFTPTKGAVRTSPAYSEFYYADGNSDSNTNSFFASGSDDGNVYFFDTAGTHKMTQASTRRGGAQAQPSASIILMLMFSDGSYHAVVTFAAEYVESLTFPLKGLFDQTDLDYQNWAQTRVKKHTDTECRKDFAEGSFDDWAVAGEGSAQSKPRPTGICPVWDRPGDPAPFNTLVELQLRRDGLFLSESYFNRLDGWTARTAPTTRGATVILPVQDASGAAAVLVFDATLGDVRVNPVPVPLSSSIAIGADGTLYGGDERGTLWAFSHCSTAAAGVAAAAQFSGSNGKGRVHTSSSAARTCACVPALAALLLAVIAILRVGM